MAAFPEITSVPFGNPVIEQIQFKTLITGFDELGREQRKQKWLYPRRLITLQYPYMSKSEAQILFQFFINMAGSYNAFSFFYPNPKSTPYSYIKEFIALGDGGTKIYGLPALYASNYTVYVNNASTSDYAITPAGGSDGEDKITFTSYLNEGAIATISFTGRLRVKCRFKEDNFTFEQFFDRLINTGVQLQGLLNDS